MQKVGLAQALLHRPRLLILDEPLSGLDPESRYNLKRTIRNISKDGTTVFFSSHILSDVQDVATRICMINNGRILSIGTIDELKSSFPMTNALEITVTNGTGRAHDLMSIPGVKEIEWVAENRFMVHIGNGEDVGKLNNMIIHEMMALGYDIISFSPMTPDLDELYMRYVGGGCS